MKDNIKYSLAFGLLGALFFIPFLGGVHLFDWDEVNFAEISREMIVLKNYLRIYIDYTPFWEKPPLFFWLQVAAMKLFGEGDFAARFPNAVCGIVTLIVLFNMGKKLYNTRFGIIWAGAYFGSVLPFLYFKSGIIDPWFNLFIFLGLYFFILFTWKKDGQPGIILSRNKWTYLVIAGLLVGLGVLTKGPVAYLIASLTLAVYWVIKKFRFYISPIHFIAFTFFAALFILGWYAVEYANNGSWFIIEFNKYQYKLFSTPDAGHAGFPGYHFVVLFFGVFPASIFAVRSFFKMPKEEQTYQQDFKLWMSILFWVVLILFTIVKSKIVHYSSLSYFPITFLAAIVIDKLIDKKISFGKWMKAGLWFTGGIFIFLTIALPFLGMNIETLKPLFKNDPFAMANLEADISWSGFESIAGFFLLFLLIAVSILFKKEKIKQGFAFLFSGVAVFIMLTLIFNINNIEGYSQRAAIEFYKSKAGEDCYIITNGFKSYAHLYYAKKQPVTNENYYNREWLLTGPIDKKVYVVSKIHRTDELKEYTDLQKIGEKNGFVFYLRNIPE